MVAHILAGLLVFMSMPYCVYTVGAQAHTGLFDSLTWPLIGLSLGLIDSLILVAMLPYLLKRMLRRQAWRKIRNTLLWLNGFSCLGLAIAAIKTLFSQHGLWQYDSYYDNHFSNSVIDFHFFSPVMGLLGIYIITVSYITFRILLAKDKRARPGTIGRKVLILAPIAGYYLLIYLHTFIPQQEFIG